jgi:hypothetical protein
MWHNKSTAGEHLIACHGLNDETVDEKVRRFFISSVSQKRENSGGRNRRISGLG